MLFCLPQLLVCLIVFTGVLSADTFGKFPMSSIINLIDSIISGKLLYSTIFIEFSDLLSEADDILKWQKLLS